MTRHRGIACFLTLFCLAAATRPAAAVDGFLDPTFWSDGRIWWSASSGWYHAWSVVSAPDGRAVVAGYDGPVPGSPQGFWRRVGDTSYSPLCHLAPTGQFTSAAVYTATFDAQGRLLVGGTFLGPNDANLLVVARYLYPDCTLDTSFNNDGIWGLNVPGGVEWARKVTVDPEGRILVLANQADFAVFGISIDVVVVRLTESGALDGAFSGNGWTVVDVTGLGLHDDAEDMVLDAAGRVVVAASTDIGDNRDWMIFALLPDGTPDAGFGVGGVRRVAFDLGGSEHDEDVAFGIALDPNGNRLVVAGRAETATGSALALARLLEDGSLDPSFSSDGKLTDALGGSAELRGVVVDGFSRIVAGGTLEDADSNADFLAVRYLPTGTLDPAFHVFGYNHVPFDAGTGPRIDDFGYAVAFQAGRVLLAGDATVDGPSGYAETRIAMARLKTDLVFADGFEGEGVGFWSKATGAD